MKKLIMFHFIISWVIMFTACRKDCIPHYTFEVPLEISPQNSILKVGDTLHVLMITDNQAMNDTFGKRIVQFPNFDPNAIFQFPMINAFPVKEGFILNEVLIDTANYDAHIGSTEHLGIGLFFFEIPNNKYESRIEFSIVLKTPGLYMLVCRDALAFSDMAQERIFPDRCGHNGILEAYFYIPQGNHNNILNSGNYEILDKYWAKSSGDKVGSDMYYFKVLE